MPITAQFTLSQYDKMIAAGIFDGIERQRFELIQGEIVQMAPIGYLHAAIVGEINELSRRHFTPEQVHIRIQAPLRMTDQSSMPEPDIQWLCPRDYFQRHPEPDDVYLVIEVAESSIETDTVDKARIYAEASIQDYWVVNIPDHCIEIFRDPTSNGYQSHTTIRGDETIRPHAFPEVAISAAQLLGDRAK
jgi:Uma2 family endonuclease